MMKEDPAINAVRNARRRISEKVGHDPRKLVEYYRQLQERHRELLVSPGATLSETRDENAA